MREDITLTVLHDDKQFQSEVEDSLDVSMGPFAERVPVIIHVGSLL